MNKTITTIVVLLVIAGGGVILYTQKPANNCSIPTDSQAGLMEDGSTNNNNGVTTEAVSTSTASAQTTKEFTIIGKSFSFTPNTIAVQKGDRVKITFKDSDGLHNIVIDGYNVKTETLESGDSSVIEFVADKVGSFEYYCSVDSHKQKGMTGTLTVKG